MKKLSLFLAIVISAVVNMQAQTDSLIMTNQNYIVGEVKTMDRGVLTVKTGYSDSDFKIEWDGIKEIYTDTYFLITLGDGSRYNGVLESVETGKVTIITDE